MQQFHSRLLKSNEYCLDHHYLLTSKSRGSNLLVLLSSRLDCVNIALFLYWLLVVVTIGYKDREEKEEKEEMGEEEAKGHRLPVIEQHHDLKQGEKNGLSSIDGALALHYSFP